MSGLSLIQPDTATGKAADLLAAVQTALGVTPNMTKAMANSPAVLKAYLDFSTALSAGALPASTRESIALLVAQENGCDYCLSAHTYIGTKLAGLSPEAATDARKGQATDARTAAALTLATSLVRNQGDVSDPELEAAGEHLSEGEIAEVVAHVALNVFTNYLNKSGRVAIDWPLVRSTD
ncbi:carboxymuconolactone decarboxylase family protein [Nonomuraea soli]|uniref:Putative peroxidase-related enzyme n=1 Tax=Nonomuraea soli TaxID=1032476 RepID=A0A7W0HSI5_9ACTN|nr:carboxymuconolactone decarboxylase family protein [Nonomuraea soli]MBA2894040.1 putative peroxidase-related enzyme [Nonomuraea soli]